MIQDLIKEYEKLQQRESELLFQLGEHYLPIIKKLFENKDRNGLIKLLDEIPDNLNSAAVYEALRELEK